MSTSSAARTNLSSANVRISNRNIGEGTFRVCLGGTYLGGNRNGQEAACKRFKPRFRSMEMEFFASDFQVADSVIHYAEKWNDFAEVDEEILVTKGHLISSNSGLKYLAEPLIRDYKKFTSNSGWVDNDGTWMTDAMAAFSHYTYHASRGQLLVCDLQGRYRNNRYNNSKSRFELTDPAICSIARSYGPTDLSEKGIESFFANHKCNGFCNKGGKWRRPSYPTMWFPKSSATSMFSSSVSHKLQSSNRTQFRLGWMGAIEEDSSDDDSW